MKYIKNNLKTILGIMAVVIVLVIAYVCGGSKPSNSKVSGNTEEISTVNVADNSNTSEEFTGLADENKKEASTKINGATDNDELSKEDSSISDSANSDSANSDSANSDSANSDSANPDTPKKDTPKKDNQKKDTPEPGTSKSDTSKQDITKPDADTKDEEPSKDSESAIAENTTAGNTTTGNSTTESTTAEDKETTYTCTISISCGTILNNMELLDEAKQSIIPKNGIILGSVTAEFSEGETVFDVLCRVTKEYGIQLEYSYTPIYNSSYIEGIYNIYEFDCGNLSGWEYSVNGAFPGYGSSEYVLEDGDVINWLYTCDLGADIGNAK